MGIEGVGFMLSHGWRQCRPAMIDLEGGRSGWALAADQIKLEVAWSLVPGRDRRLFHEYCCMNHRKSEDHLDAMERVTRILMPVLDGHD
jgi:hypothetical protein